MTATEYDIARTDFEKCFAALAIASRKATVETAWDWARIACNHAEALGIQHSRRMLGTGAWPDLVELGQAIDAARESEILIVTRHAGFVEWLAQRGLHARVIERATPSDVMGKDVIGNLPKQLEAIAWSVTRVAIPGCPSDRRQDELTAAELDEYGAFLRTYKTQEIAAIQW
jgi:putative CRISPR-associated protein (TIGR02620 family)